MNKVSIVTALSLCFPLITTQVAAEPVCFGTPVLHYGCSKYHHKQECYKHYRVSLNGGAAQCHLKPGAYGTKGACAPRTSCIRKPDTEPKKPCTGTPVRADECPTFDKKNCSDFYGVSENGVAKQCILFRDHKHKHKKCYLSPIACEVQQR